MDEDTSGSICTTANMDFVTPKQYSKSNLAHYNINSRAATDLVSLYTSLGSGDRLLDFGCGTGESTVAMARGVLGGLGTPGEVVGVDISEDMISHCRTNLQTSPVPGLSFHQLDVTRPESFLASNMNRFSCLTSFSCLHWVQDMPAAVSLFNKVLKVGGKFVFVIATSTVKSRFRFVFEEMKKEEKWAEILNKTSWMHFNTVNVNNYWMSNVDKKNGYGNIKVEDFVSLMENHGFKVDDVKPLDLNYKLSEDVMKAIAKTAIGSGFPEIVGLERKEFFTEFMSRADRLKHMEKQDADGYYDLRTEGFQIIGEKLGDFINMMNEDTTPIHSKDKGI